MLSLQRRAHRALLRISLWNGQAVAAAPILSIIATWKISGGKPLQRPPVWDADSQHQHLFRASLCVQTAHQSSLPHAAAEGSGKIRGVCAEITYGIDQGACTCEYADSDAAVVESATSGKTIAWAQNAGVPSEMAALSNGLLHLIRIRVPAITLSTVLGKRKATTMTPHHEEVDVKRMLRSLPTGAVAADAWSAIVDGSQNRTESSVLSLLSSNATRVPRSALARN